MNLIILLAAVLALYYAIARQLLPLRLLLGLAAIFLGIFTLSGGFNFFWGLLVWSAFALPCVLFGVPGIRLAWLSKPLLRRIRKVLPPMSETERAAIEAGR